MTPVEAVLSELRGISATEHEKGDRFEQLMLHAFRTDRTFTKQFTNVWRWADWPKKKTTDIGVDLVAETADGGLVAIQCKCYDPSVTLHKVDVDSFISESSKEHWVRRIIVSTTDRWSTHAEEALDGHKVPIERLGIDHLDDMTVDWSTYDLANPSGLKPTAKHELLTHQQAALKDVLQKFETHDRGKLVMACGTGKTFTALRIAEAKAGVGGAVLFLAPSIALVAQSLKEWTAEASLPIQPFAVCSDASAGKPVDGENASPHDLVIPPTTDPAALVEAGVSQLPDRAMTVVFSTYQSIEVVAEAQRKTGLVFDLIVCDEAHRTAGITAQGDQDKAFGLAHDNDAVPALARLYMTATPKLFKPTVKEAASEADAVLASMDDEEFFGPEFHRLGFGDAVEQGLLADYQVLVLAVDEQAISRKFQGLLSDGDGVLGLPDVAKFVGCLSALSKLPGASSAGFKGGETPMQRAVAFWSKIKESEQFATQFQQVAEAYFEQLQSEDDNIIALAVPTRHVDGTDKISSRRADIRWLKETPPAGECRVLTNAQCLTEGVDVPALDAVMFLTPRRSKIDIVQAVGRVMRKPPGKELGYVILPVAIPSGAEPSVALDKNKDYDAVWEVLQALRAHDERFNAYINQIALSSTAPDPDGKIAVIGVPGEDPALEQPSLFDYEEWTEAIYTKIVSKVGSRTYWEDWAADVAKIAARHETRITAILEASAEARAAFDGFLGDLRSTLNESISVQDAVSMVSQHLITRPIFEALFGDDAFANANPVSLAMSGIVAVLDSHNLDTETDKLEGFYKSIQRRIDGIPPGDGEARQKVIKDLYGRFFKIAFPKVADSLGIVYTPIEVVDFIVRAVEAVLNEHFDGAGLGDEGVHVLDPFTGTGTFITRLLQSGLVGPGDFKRKYEQELHANELLLLAYYIAAVNIETTYRQHSTQSTGTDEGYLPFPGVVLTDTFQLGEAGDGSGAWDVFPINNERAARQKKLDIRVVFGNPPYSAGQDSANDDNANLKYPLLDASIASTYAARSSATLKNTLYDSYVRAIRWASNRLIESPQGGVVAFVTNGGYIDDNSTDGLRLTVADEFQHVYVLNLRGNQRKSDWRKEGGKIFDEGSQATVAVLVLVRQPGGPATGGAKIHYRDIGDYLSRQEKLDILASYLLPGIDGSISLADLAWTVIQPNEHGDWINQRSESFAELTPAHADKGPSIFGLRSSGVKTGRDWWNFHSSKDGLLANQQAMIDHFNTQVAQGCGRMSSSPPPDLDPQRFKWTDKDFARLQRGKTYGDEDIQLTSAMYRPFHKRMLNFAPALTNRSSEVARIYQHGTASNLTICLPSPGSMAPPFCALMTDVVIDTGLYAASATTMFPRFVYDDSSVTVGDSDTDLFSSEEEDSPAGFRHNVTRATVLAFRALDSSIEADDVFFYVYGILHSPDYRSAFGADLRKALPRIPQVGTAEEFWAFSNAGGDLSALHTGYESVEVWPTVSIVKAQGFDPSDATAYRVAKTKHPKAKDGSDDRKRIQYNDRLTVAGIPERAYAYELGSKSALGWVMEAWRIRKDKTSGIVNDPNDWATEHDDPTYILDLIGRVVTVSMRTLDIIDNLPPLTV